MTRGDKVEYETEVIKMKNVNNTLIDIYLYHLILDDFSKLREMIEKEIVEICDPSIDYSSNEVKKELSKILSTKSSIQQHGMCAEFFMHLFLRDLGYCQKCVFSNLEENSMKKGFDGFYELSSEFWVAESKCAVTESKHVKKIKEALQDIDNKFSCTSGNNPWKNAIHHLMVSQCGRSNESLHKKISELSKDYSKGFSHSSSEFNLIPTSTMFINNNQSNKEIKSDIEKVLASRTIKKMLVLCINNDVFDEFISYLKGE